MLSESQQDPPQTEQAIIRAYLSRHTAPARQAMRAKFEQAADPEGLPSPAERARRVAELRREHYARIGRIGGLARRARERSEGAAK